MVLIAAIVLALLLLYGEMFYFKKRWAKNLKVGLSFSQNGVNAGEHCELKEVIYNEKNMALPVFEVKFSTSSSFQFEDQKNAVVTDKFYRKDLFCVQKYQKVTRTMDFVATKRGYYELPEVNVLVKDYLMSQQYVNRYPCDSSLVVYPKKVDTRRLKFLYSKLMGEVVSKKRVEEDLYSFRGLREYQPTDSMRRINWKASAHNSNLLVNMYDTTTTMQACIIADGNVRMPFDEDDIKEEILSLASSIADQLIMEGISVRLISNYADVLTKERVVVSSSAHRSHRETIDTALARANTKMPIDSILDVFDGEIQSLGNTSNQCFFLITTERSAEFLEKIKYYQRKGICIFTIFPYTAHNTPKISVPQIYKGVKQVFAWEVYV